MSEHQMARSHFTPDSSFPTKNGTQQMNVKINPGAQVNTIPLSQYWMIFPHKISETRLPKPSTLSPTSPYLDLPQWFPKFFLGYFIADIQHATLPRSYPIQFYIFKDATSSISSPPMLHWRG